MLIYPAIDLIGGDAVRLYQGDYNKQSTFGDPVGFAVAFRSAGAKYLHVVDLDGAKAGAPRNLDSVKAIRAAVPDMFIELGGGIRDEQAAARYFDLGIDRVILGTAALKNQTFAREMAARYPDSIAVGIDARDGRVAIEGWTDNSDTDSIEFCSAMRNIGVRNIIYTDISKDGAGQGTNIEVYKTLAKIEGLDITASGGISSLSDIETLRDMNLYAAIIGKALYTGDVDLAEALAAATRE